MCMFYSFEKTKSIIYLDQNKWIDLAKASVGHPGGKQFLGILEQIKLAAKNGKAIFPLSVEHFIETRRQKNFEKRKILAEIMAEISMGIVMAPRSYIRGQELDCAIADVFDIQTSPMPSVLGYGMPLIFGRNFIEKDIQAMQMINSTDVLKDAITFLSSKDQIIDFLVGDDESLTAEMIKGLTSINQSFIDKIQQSKEEESGSSDDFRERLYLAVLTKELLPEINASLDKYGKTFDSFKELGLKKIRSFYHNIPTLDVEIEVAIALNKQRDRKLRVNDTADIAFVSKAVPYCNIVVTENFLHSIMLQRRLDKKYNTVILTDLNQLTTAFGNL